MLTTFSVAPPQANGDTLFSPSVISSLTPPPLSSWSLSCPRADCSTSIGVYSISAASFCPPTTNVPSQVVGICISLPRPSSWSAAVVSSFPVSTSSGCCSVEHSIFSTVSVCTGSSSTGSAQPSSCCSTSPSLTPVSFKGLSVFVSSSSTSCSDSSDFSFSTTATLSPSLLTLSS